MDEELKLTVTLVDNATPQLARIKGAMAELGGSGTHNALRETHKHTQTLGALIGKLGHDIEHVAKHILPSYVLGIGGAATGMLALGLASEKALGSMKEFSKEMVQLDQLSRKIGVGSAQIKSMTETFEKAGIDAGTARQNISGLAEDMADLTRAHSELRTHLIQMAGPEHAEEMQRALIGLSTNDLGEFANQIKKIGDDIYNNMLQQQLKEIKAGENVEEHRQAAMARAAQARKKFFEDLHAPELLQVEEEFAKNDLAREKHFDEMIKSAKEFARISADIGTQWDHITEEWKSDALEKLLPYVREMDKFFKDWAEKGFFGAVTEEGGRIKVAGAKAHEKQLEVNKQEAEEREARKQSTNAAIGNWFKSIRTAVRGYQGGGFIDRDQLAMLHAGETVIPGEGAESIEKQTKATDELTEQMKKLTDLMTFTVTTRMGGLAPGLGVGPGSVGGRGFGGVGAGDGVTSTGIQQALRSGFEGAGGGGGAGWGGGSGSNAGGGGARGGGGGQPYGSDVGAGGITNDATVPGNIIETAKHVAATQGPAGVEAFMRSQGYPKAGSWCGEFAASVVKASGGTPPQNPAVASNWRNWGVADPTPHVGDIAVAGRNVPTGATGSHVTFVSNVDPKTGRFTGLGGNQGGTLKESNFAIGGYTFRRPTPAEQEKMAAQSGATPQTQTAAAGAGGGSGAEFLRQQRAPFTQELEEKPWLKRHLAGLATLEHEEDRTAVVESLYNRTALVNQERAKRGLPPVSLEHMINPGGAGSFYGPERKGIVDSRAAQLARDPAAYKRALEDIDAAASSNLLRGATDQGSGRDPNVNWQGGKVVRYGETYNDWEYGGSHRAAQKFRETQQAQVSAADRAAMDRQMATKVEGTGKLDVNVNAPKGTTVNAQGGGLFKEVNVARQTQMDRASTSADWSSAVGE